MDESTIHPARNVLNMLAKTAHAMSDSKGFWAEENAVMSLHPEMTPIIMGNKLALIHSEVSEVLEALRKPEPVASKKIPPYMEEEDECADILIRLMDYCGKRNIDIGGAVIQKMLYNANRPFKHGKTM